jgi:FK506-binding protein 2
MRVATFLSSLLFAAVAVLAAEPPKELQIETTYLPDDCPAKAAKGDQIKVLSELFI